MRYKGIQKIKQTFSAAQTGYEPLGGFECFTEGQFDAAFLDEQLYALNEGMKQVTGQGRAFTNASAKINEFGMTGFSQMIENSLEGGIHSGRYVESLTAYVKELGVRILSGIEMTSYERKGSGFSVFTTQPINQSNNQPITFNTKQILLTTNAWLWKQAPELGIVPARGQVIVSPNIGALPLRGTFHFDGGYYYFRNLGNRVLIGGARNSDFAAEETLELETTYSIKNLLYSFLQKHVPAAAAFPLQSFDNWSGLMAMHPGKAPVLEQTVGGAWAAMCCNGMGVALSPVFSEKVASSIINGLN